MSDNQRRGDDPFKLDAGLIANIVLLLIPGLQFFGGLWLYSRIKRKFKLQFPANIAVLFILLAVASGDVISGVAGFLWPIAAALLVGVATFMAVNTLADSREDILNYLRRFDSCEIEDVMDIFSVSERKLRFYFRVFKRRGKLRRDAYIDEKRRMLVMVPEEYEAARKAERPKSRPEAAPAAGETGEMSQYEKILKQIRELNDRIPDRTMTEKIYRIESLTANIFHLVELHPERATEIQGFLEYYLPATLKLLSRYAEIVAFEQSGARGENMTSSKADIEGIMDKVVEGFEKQLDRLFKSDAIDITNDVKVLEKMMRMEGLNKKD